MKFFISIFFILAIPTLSFAEFPQDVIKLPEGFHIEIFADNIPDAREITLSPSGTLFVSTRGAGTVYAVVDKNKDGKADKIYTIAKGLRFPNGVAFREGSLYVAEINRILRFDKIEKRLHKPPKPVVINDTFPSSEHHGWKFIAFGPDGWLYIPIGAPCNVCKQSDERYASIMRMTPDGGKLELFAKGVRNTVGFDWHPITKELWFTDNGRDMMGDDVPPDELNRAAKQGLNFGFPYCHGKSIADPRFGSQAPCSNFMPAEVELGPHVASLGMEFYTGKMFPEEYRNQIFIAEHGSWNRSTPIGYRITVVRFEDGKPPEYRVFAEGWRRGNILLGRPVDVEVMPDGSLLVSDDAGGRIYRITYQK